jgi:hypothetical protein
MELRRIRQEVEDLRIKLAIQAEDVFPIWYLRRRYFLPNLRAQMRCSDPAAEGDQKGHDFGLDAYHIDRKQDPPRLVLVQAKYSEGLVYVGKGFRDLARATKMLGEMLERLDVPPPVENRIITNLRHDLQGLTQAQRDELGLEFVVIHLCREDDEIIAQKTKAARDELSETVEHHFADRVRFYSQLGPRRFVFSRDDEIVIPERIEFLSLDHVSTSAIHNDRPACMHYGLGHLAELVTLYEGRRDALFAKNVRYFLTGKKAQERGPAGRMRETLKAICIEKHLPPEIFAFYHNGVTIYAETAEPADRGLHLRAPFVLNGCQTVKSAYLFHSDPRLRDKIDEEAWNRVLVPLKVITSKDEALVRQITINNNRQNAIPPEALRANDPVQLRLQDRFRKIGIFYERQEGAFEVFQAGGFDWDEYENTRGRCVNIVDLGRALASVAGGVDLVNYAHHANDIFESDPAYDRIFSEKRIASITFLTFLQNLYDVVPVVLKRNLNLQQVQGGPRPGRLTFYATCLLVRYLAKNDERGFVKEYGRALWGRNEAFRKELVTYFSHHRSGIKAVLQDKFMALTDASQELLRDAFSRAETALRLGNNIEVFGAFANLDAEVEDEEAEPTA